ncbi:MAG TPA: hypothetical protein VJP80_02425 [Candidatus Saccharimonadales bacterium]|nr:hypothetical protein [Candidatus Saccharimonadales bacterium]
MSQSVWAVEGKDKNFQHYRTDQRWQDLRKWVDDAYYGRGLNAVLDKNFVEQLQNHDFFARLWELELAEWLYLARLKLIPTKGKGPDFCVELPDGRKVWIEAVLATADEKMDKQWRSRIGEPGLAPMYHFPKDENWLRYGSSLYTKATKIKAKYIDKGMVDANDFMLIAISAFPPGALHSDIEHFMRAALPIGDPVVHFSTDGKPLDPNVTRSTHTDKVEHTKENGTPVLKQFLYPGTYFPFIDGVLFSEASNLQGLLGVVFNSRFDDTTNTPHIFPNHASQKSLPDTLTDNFYLHEFAEDNPAFMSLRMIDPKKKLT